MRLLLAAFALAAIISFPTHAQEQLPVYDSSGQLLLPENYREWVFVGANLGLVYTPEAHAMTARETARAAMKAFHNVYIDPTAYAAFRKTGQFPDPTMLVMEVFEAKTKDAGGVLREGMFPGDRTMVEAAVKDSRRPVTEGPREIWTYYVFPVDATGKPAASAGAFPDAACFVCHKAHAKPDNVWVEFYPALRDLPEP